jgi:hypothetical protein
MNLLSRQPDRDAEYQDEKEFSLEACKLIDVAGLRLIRDVIHGEKVQLHEN